MVIITISMNKSFRYMTHASHQRELHTERGIRRKRMSTQHSGLSGFPQTAQTWANSPLQVTHLPPVWDLSPGIDTR